jgi:hypothetical protein
MADPDLTAELDAAEDIVTGRAEAIVTEWGVRVPYEVPRVAPYGSDEWAARRDVARGKDLGYALVRRTVTYGPWEDVPRA